MARNERHVVPRASGWAVVKPSGARASALEPTQDAAIARARAILEDAGGGEVVIHGRDNRVRDSETIPPAHDPNPPRDQK